jgi:hypothetical protein
LVHMGLLYLLVIWLSWFLHFSQVMGASAFLRCHGLIYVMELLQIPAMG